MRRLPTFQHYTVDCRLREFRRVRGRSIEFHSFDSPTGQKLLAEMKRLGGHAFIGVWTIGMMGETSAVREAVEREFNRQAKMEIDWFYVVRVMGKKFFVVENGECGYTAMKPDEY